MASKLILTIGCSQFTSVKLNVDLFFGGGLLRKYAKQNRLYDRERKFLKLGLNYLCPPRNFKQLQLILAVAVQNFLADINNTLPRVGN